MGYLYDVVKEMLGGDKFASGSKTSTKGWSPNNVKVLVISREFVFVGYHISRSNFKLLAREELLKDLRSNGASGAIHNLLSQRQLSCLEEIYVDGMFQNYKGLFDLEGYVGKLLNDKSRLRYYGYGDFPLDSKDFLYSKFFQSYLNGDYLYSYALDSDRKYALQYKTVGNNSWYKNFNLRPMYYSMDSDGGNLNIYFNKGVKKIENMLLAKSREQELNTRQAIISALFENDVLHFECFSLLLNVVNTCSKCPDDLVCRCTRTEILSTLKNIQPIKGFSVETLKKAGLTVSNQTEVNLIKTYQKLKIFDSNSREDISAEDLQDLLSRKTGFLDIPGLLDNICLNICNKLISLDRLYGMLTTKTFLELDSEIPTGKLRAAFKRPNNTNEKAQANGYLKFIFGLCGWSAEIPDKLGQGGAK